MKGFKSICSNFTQLDPNRMSDDKFRYLLSSEGKVSEFLGQFCHEAFSLRTEILQPPPAEKKVNPPFSRCGRAVIPPNKLREFVVY